MLVPKAKHVIKGAREVKVDELSLLTMCSIVV